MTIYITGISGMLGHVLATCLTRLGTVAGCARKKCFHPTLPQMDVFDLSDRQTLESHLGDAKPDVIIHTAAMIGVDECERQPEEAFNLNSRVSGNIAKIAQSLGAKVVYISTDSVFSGNQEEPYTETDEPKPINIYGQSKLEGEKKILSAHSENLVLRTNIFGWSPRKAMSFAEWIYDALKNQKSINLINDVQYSPIHVLTLARIIEACVRQKITGIHHAAGLAHLSKYEFGKALAEAFQFPPDCLNSVNQEDIDFFAPRSRNMKLDSSRLRYALKMENQGLNKDLRDFYQLKDEYEQYFNQ